MALVRDVKENFKFHINVFYLCDMAEPSETETWIKFRNL